MLTKLNWRDREAARQNVRVPPIWRNEPFWIEHAGIHAHHFVHVSESDPSLLAYTQSEEKGERDIQTPVKPGKYLMTYFKHILPEKHIKFLAEWQIEGGAKPVEEASKYELLYARTPEEIYDVYVRGPASCMDGNSFSSFDRSPVKAYGGGDLAVAYIIGDPPPKRSKTHNVLARCVVYPEGKAASRLYPTEGNLTADGYPDSNAQYAKHSRLISDFRTLLKSAGYRFGAEGGNFAGAKIPMMFRHELSDPTYDAYWWPSLEINPGYARVENGMWIFDPKGTFYGGRGPKRSIVENPATFRVAARG